MAAAKKKKKKPRRARTQKRKQLADHKRRLQRGPLRDAKMRIEPEGQVKMSAVLEDFVEPYLDLVDTGPGRRMLFTLGVLAWNAALRPPEERQAMVDTVLDEGLPAVSEKSRGELKELVAEMIGRKLDLFPDIRRYIVSHELTDQGHGFYLSVASFPLGERQVAGSQ